VKSCFKSKSLSVLLLLLTLLLPANAIGALETVLLPVTLDYPFIRSLLVHQLYNLPGERTVIIDKAEEDCVHIELWKPEVSRELSMIKVGSNIKIRAGIPIVGTCMGLFEWEGYIEVLQNLVLDEKLWQARFETVDSRLYNVDRKPATIAGRFWDIVKTHVHPYLNQTSIELALPLREMKTFLPLVFRPEERQRVDHWLDTLKLGKVRIEESAVKVHILMDVETITRPLDSAVQLSPSEIERLSRAWEDWDAFLVFEIEALIGQPVTDSERASLLEMLLENRHEFLQAISQKTIGTDLVRQQFIRTWQRLSQVLRKHLVNQKSHSSFSYLAFFTASDALVALDMLGPSLGLEVSRDGLVRLARLLSKDLTDPTLTYSYSVDVGLRKFLGLGPPLDDAGPTSNVQEPKPSKDLEKGTTLDDRQSWLGDFLFPRAWAAEGHLNRRDQLRHWIPPAGNAVIYIERVRNVLEGAADNILATHLLAEEYHPFLRRLVLSTAWQESCWRQFTTQEGKLNYLVSYNQSSVGLMQINERVWRGIYRVESLRWNITYNAKAGCEILDLYLRTFALKEIKPESAADFDTIARVTYAMYNGGPGQLKEFSKRHNTNRLYKSDRLFWEKYTAAKEGKYDQLEHCL
jgi:hypothetical protein